MYRYLSFDILNRRDPRKEAQFWELFFAVDPATGRSDAPPSIESRYLRKLLHESKDDLDLSHDVNFMVALDGFEPVARLSMNRTLHDQSLGYFGCFDYKIGTHMPPPAIVAENSTISAGCSAAAMSGLLERAEKWFLQKGITRILGPVCLSTWFPYRLQAENFEGHVFSWEPKTPLEYHHMLASHSFLPEYSYGTFCVEDLVSIWSSVKRYEEKALSDGFVLRTLPQNELNRNIEVLHKLTIETFEGNFLFENLPFGAFAKLYLAGQNLQTSKLNVDLVYDSSGSPVGFMLSQIEDGHLVLKTMGIKKAFRRSGLAFALASWVIRTGLEKRCTKLVGALVFADGKSMTWWRDLTKDGKALWHHKYSLFSKKLSESAKASNYDKSTNQVTNKSFGI